ncbi:MAG TPA: hypothetical protein VFQ70_04635, partial [Candidatus Saccharimonadaceae bacterium]|nr:hypothetical protein [Candidatus Saccharimonadaceae bacterium]
QMSKHDASEYFNARSLRFDPAEGKDTYEAFVEKALTLLSCPPEQFGRSYHLAQKKDGTYKMRHRGTGIAKGVLEILKAPHAV